MKLSKEMLALYAVTDSSWLKPGETLEEAAEKALRGGVTILQYRDKEGDADQRLDTARKLKTLCSRYGVPFIINDDVDLALAVDADGIHVGQNDMEPGMVRALVGAEKIIGVSVHTAEQALSAQQQGADYLGVGAVFPTGTKMDAEYVSHIVLQEICKTVNLPVVAIGGITKENLAFLSGCGTAGVAVVSAIFGQDDIETAAKNMRNLVDTIAKGGEQYV